MKRIIPILSTLLALLICSTCSNPAAPESELKQQQQNYNTPAFQLFPTTNMWTFIKLDTRNGQIWQVQYDIQGDDRMEVILNDKALVSDEEAENGRFILYSTKTCSHSFSSTNTMVECGKCNGLSMPTNGLLFL